MMFAVKTEFLRALLNDPEWKAKLEKAKTMRQVETVFRDFAKAKGYKIKEVRIDEEKER